MGSGLERSYGGQVAADTQGSAAQQLMMMAGVSVIPHSFIVDRGGKIQYSGHPMDPKFEHILEKVNPATLHSEVHMCEGSREGACGVIT